MSESHFKEIEDIGKSIAISKKNNDLIYQTQIGDSIPLLNNQANNNENK